MTPQERAELEARADVLRASLERYRAKVRAMDHSASKLSAEFTRIRLTLLHTNNNEGEHTP